MRKIIFLTILNLSFFISARAQISQYLAGSSYNGLVKVYDLYENGSRIGNSFWFDRTGGYINAYYLAYKDLANNRSVLDRYNEFLNKEEVVFACSGSLAIEADDYIPVGLTIDNGRLINENIVLNEFDALVVVYPLSGGAGLAVTNLDEGNISFGEYNNVDIRNTINKKRFINWAIDEKATCFQTQLLVWKNSVVNDLKYDGKNASRRFLAAIRSYDGTLFHVVFYSSASQTLYDFTHNLVDMLQRQNYEVIWMVNLDTGMFNIQRFYNNKNLVSEYYVGSMNSDNDVTNLIIWFYLP